MVGFLGSIKGEGHVDLLWGRTRYCHTHVLSARIQDTFLAAYKAGELQLLRIFGQANTTVLISIVYVHAGWNSA